MSDKLNEREPSESTPAVASELQIPSPRVLERRVRALGCCFFLLFFSYISIQQLQSSINGDLGYYCNLSAYLVFAVSAVTAPYFISRFNSSLGLLLGCSALAYVFTMTQNIVVFPGPFMASCAVVGATAGTLWVGQGAYVAACAVAVALATGEALTDASSRLNGIFFAAFQFSGCLGGTFAALLLMFAGPGALTLLFSILSSIGFCAMLMFCCLLDPGAPGQKVFAFPSCGFKPTPRVISISTSATPVPTPLVFIKFLCGSRRLMTVLPLLFSMGAFQAVGFATLTASLVAPALGLSVVSWMGVVYYFSSFVSTSVASTLAQLPRIGRRWILAVVGFIWVACIGAMLAWESVWPSTGAGAVLPPQQIAYPILFLFAIVLGSGDGVFFSMISATLQTWFPNESAFAYAALRSSASLGTAVFCGIGPLVSASTQFIALIIIFCVSALLFTSIHVYDISIDAKECSAKSEPVIAAVPELPTILFKGP